MIAKGTLLTWVRDSKIYTAKPGAKAIAAENFIEGDEFIRVEWIRDELSGRQNDGEYHITAFEVDEPCLNLNIIKK